MLFSGSLITIGLVGKAKRIALVCKATLLFVRVNDTKTFYIFYLWPDFDAVSYTNEIFRTSGVYLQL